MIPEPEPVKRCARCGCIRTDNVASDICGCCADDLRLEEDTWNGQNNSDTGVD